MCSFVITLNDGNIAFLTSLDGTEKLTIKRNSDETKEDFVKNLKPGLTVTGTPSDMCEPAPGVN